MTRVDVSEPARKRFPLFILAAAAIATVGFLEWHKLINPAVDDYVEAGIWFGLYSIILNEFRKLEFQSKYIRWIFIAFSISFLAQLIIDLPIMRDFFPSDRTPIRDYVNIVTGACWTVSCGLVLHGLLASVQSVEQESHAKELACGR